MLGGAAAAAVTDAADGAADAVNAVAAAGDVAAAVAGSTAFDPNRDGSLFG